MVANFNEYRMQNIKDYLQHISEFYEEKLKTWTKMGGVKPKIHHILKRSETVYLRKQIYNVQK